jgi:hypothetical protein
MLGVLVLLAVLVFVGWLGPGMSCCMSPAVWVLLPEDFAHGFPAPWQWQHMLLSPSAVRFYPFYWQGKSLDPAAAHMWHLCALSFVPLSLDAAFVELGMLYSDDLPSVLAGAVGLFGAGCSGPGRSWDLPAAGLLYNSRVASFATEVLASSYNESHELPRQILAHSAVLWRSGSFCPYLGGD